MTNNPKTIAGYRFASKVFKKDSKTKHEFKKNTHVKKSKHCGICKQAYEGYVRIVASSNGVSCFHDRPSLVEDPHLTAGEQKRIGSKLAPNEFAVKDRDGIIRILEK